MQSNLVASGTTSLATNAFGHAKYTIKRPFFTFFGRKFHVYAPDGTMVMYVNHKLFTWKDEWIVYSDESEKTPLLRVKARAAIALNMTTDVTDAQTGEKVGTIRARGLKSILHDTWDILDLNDQPVGLFTEDSLAILRRFLPILLGKWHGEMGGQKVVMLSQVFRFFTKEFTLDLSMSGGRIDPRLAVACSLLALTREIQREQS